MTKEQIQVYTKRITQANTSGLAVILYELTSIYIEEGKTAYKAGRTEEFERSILQAQSFLQELMSMSKMENQTGYDVMSLYLFIDKQLLLSIVKKQPVNLDECAGYLNKLRTSFEKLAETDTEEPLMEHVQQVYAGLTYGRGYLNESVDPAGDPNRGLKA